MKRMKRQRHAAGLSLPPVEFTELCMNIWPQNEYPVERADGTPVAYMAWSFVRLVWPPREVPEDTCDELGEIVSDEDFDEVEVHLQVLTDPFGPLAVSGDPDAPKLLEWYEREIWGPVERTLVENPTELHAALRYDSSQVSVWPQDQVWPSRLYDYRIVLDHVPLKARDVTTSALSTLAKIGHEASDWVARQEVHILNRLHPETREKILALS